MMKKILLVVMCVLLLALPSFGAMSDDDFIELCKTGTAQQVEQAIKAGASVNAKNIFGETALMNAVRYNKNPKVIAALIKAKADVNAKNDTGWTVLMFAARYNPNAEVINALIQAGADVNAKIIFDVTALMLAAEKNPNAEVINALIQAGADVNDRDSNGQNALDHAKMTRNTAAIKCLEPLSVMRDADFIKLCRTGTAQQVEQAIKAGANVNAKDKDVTALMFAAKNNPNPEVITVLVKAGANLNAKNIYGKV